MTTGIYKLKFANGSQYIGQALNMEERYRQHCQKLQDATHTAKMLVAYANCNFQLPTFELLLDCHKDYLNLFESIFIHEMSPDTRLNTSIPENAFTGGTQQTLDILVANRHNSIISIVDKLSSLGAKVEGLKLSLCEAEDEIEDLEFKRNEEEVAAAGKTRVIELKQEILKLTSKCAALSSTNNCLQQEVNKLNTKIRQLNSRGWIARLFNL